MNHRSLLFLCSLACVAGVGGVRADAPSANGEATAAAAATQPAAPLTPAQLDELLSPVALYPDPLIAIILPASTFPADLVLAARYLQGGGAADAIDSQPWDDSVKALARYPEVVKWMDSNLAWTKQVGAAFAQQPADVLTCTQRLRTAARAAGNLKDTPEQKVVVERETIRIVPANPEIIYVPVYEPSWVYGYHAVDFYHPGPLIRFSSGYRTGYWLAYHCDWNRWSVVVINRPYRVAYWRDYPKWRCPDPAVAHVRHVWRPDPVRNRVVAKSSRPAADTTLPRATVGNQASPGASLGRPAQPAIRPASSATVASRAPAQASPSPAPASAYRRAQVPQVNGSGSLVTPTPGRGQLTPEPARPRNRLVGATTTGPTAAPGSPSSANPSAPAPRIQFPSTGGAAGPLSAYRPRPAAASAAPSVSVPARTSTVPLAAPRRPSEARPLSAPTASRTMNVSPQASPRSRMQSGDAAGFPSPTALPEGENSGFRRRR